MTSCEIIIFNVNGKRNSYRVSQQSRSGKPDLQQALIVSLKSQAESCLDSLNLLKRLQEIGKILRILTSAK